MLGFEFCIDTGACPPVACRQTHYGVHEGPIIQQHIDTLIRNKHIRPLLGGAWLSKGLLAPKPHQEHVDNIDDFIWRWCINYRPLNAVTKPFLHPIPRCDDTFDCFHDRKGRHLHFISYDAKSGYHQIAVHGPDQEKTAFYGPDFHKYCYIVMPFGPLNAPAVYTAINQILCKEANSLFSSRFPTTHPEDVGNEQIIDDGTCFSFDPWLCLRWFRCLCEVYVKYRLSFNLKKCDFFLSRFEWLGNDIRTNGNSPAISKFDLIRDWTLPRTGVSLSSLVGLAGFYNRFIPHFEEHVHELRTLSRVFHRQPIPMPAWTPHLVNRFEHLKRVITRDPVLARFSKHLPIFLKTDWSSHGMSYVLMQPADDDASRKALKILETTGENTFDKLMTGARL